MSEPGQAALHLLCPVLEHALHVQNYVAPVSAVQLTDLHAGVTPGVNEIPAADVDTDMTGNRVALETSGYGEEDQVAGLQRAARYPSADIVLIFGQPGQIHPEFLKDMACKGRAVEALGLFIRSGTEIIRHTEKFLA